MRGLGHGENFVNCVPVTVPVIVAGTVHMTTESLTYKELAARLGVKLESARKTVLRKKWQRVTGNDGQVRILVPVDALDSHKDSPNDRHQDSHSDSPIPSPLELQLRIEGLKELIESERRRADAAELDRDRWYALAVRPWWKRLAG